jgi:hypothetical protein
LVRLGAFFAIVGVLLLAGCARPVGDFGRADPDALHDVDMPAVGTLLHPRSDFNLTDQEREMRDRVWRYLVSPHANDWFGDTAVELQRTGIAPRKDKPLPVDRYYRWLHGTVFASSPVRFDRISSDITSDIDTLPSTFTAICAVIEIDRRRGVASNGIAGLEDKVLENAAARQQENRTIIAWFTEALTNRYDSYSYALDHLLIETPHEQAVRTNGLLNDLDVYVEAAGRNEFCNGPSRPSGHSDTIVIPSRILHDRTILGS